MLRLLTFQEMASLVKTISIRTFLAGLIQQLEHDYARWSSFEKTARVAFHAPEGVLELMPIRGPDYFAFKYVNGYPNNPKQGKRTVVATGQLAEVASGYPVLLCEMTLLTALRTAASAALVAQKALISDFNGTMLLYGAGAQAAFLVMAHHVACGVQRVLCYDPDACAAKKLQAQMQQEGIEVVVLDAVAPEVIQASRLIVTATAHEGHHVLFAAEHVAPGTHINALGGDGAGKTELDPALLDRADIIVQYAPQTRVEGEIQNREGIALYASVHALCEGTLHARQRDQSITLFDSVGFALEDYSALVYVLNESTRLGAGSDAALLPQSDDPKDLFAFLA